MKRLKILTFFFFLIVLSIVGGSQESIDRDLDDKEKPKGIVIDSDVFSMEWNIKKTGAEENLDVSYNEINRTTTEFCIKPNDKLAYESSLLLSDKDITNVPITKTDNVDVFTLEKQSFDLSIIDEKTKEPIEQCFKIHYPFSFNNLSFKIGWESIEIDGSAYLGAIVPPFTDSMVYNSTGGLHFVYEDNADDWWYCESSNRFVDFSCKEIFTGTVQKVGLIINSTDGMMAYGDEGADSPLDVLHSSDGGHNWALGTDAGANSHGYSSCATGDNDGPHCVTISNNNAFYVNKTNWGTGVDIDGSEGFNAADIEVDENGVVWIPGVGTTNDNVVLVTSLTGWGSNLYTLKDLGSYITVQEAPSIAICGQNAYIAFSHNADAYLFNFSIDDPSVWNETIVDTDPSHSVVVKCTSDGDVYLFYSDDSSTSVDSGHDIFYSNASSSLTGWTVRTERIKADPWGLQNIAGSNFPTFNRIKNKIDYIAMASDSDLHYDNLTVAYTAEAPTDSCTYGGAGNWQIESIDNCTLRASNTVVSGTLIVNSSGGELILNNANLTVSGFNFRCTDCKMVIRNNSNFIRTI